MLIRHPSVGCYVVACMSLEPNGEANVIHIYMVFQVMRFNDSTRSSVHEAIERISDPRTKPKNTPMLRCNQKRRWKRSSQ